MSEKEIMQDPEEISNLDTGSVKEYVDELEKDQDTDAWKKLFDLLNGYDDKTRKDWQDELANLLTFTGLFSAVATGFVAYSLPKLEEDFMGTLFKILRAAGLGGGSISADDSSLPDHRIVNVNVLWMVNLTLILMAAFFTITVQQWLRQISPPSQLTVRQAVRLRQLRYNGIPVSNVPAVVSLLPTLVQLSVLLFLIGLLLQLNLLNQTVFAAFGGIAGTFFALYLVTVSLPLIWSQCPYKSPVVPTI